MATKNRVAPTPQTPALLPIPRGLLDFHLRVLQPFQKNWTSPPSALLLTGLEGIGKTSLSLWLSQWFLCENNPLNTSSSQTGLFGDLPDSDANTSSSSPIPEPCGECANCQSCLSQNWFDLTWIEPDRSGKNPVIKIDQLREMKTSQGHGAFRGGIKVVLITDAHTMTVQAANSVLKILEEPPPQWIFILTALDGSLLLPTIVSRCQRIRLRPLSVATISSLLSDVEPNRREPCSRLAHGSLKKAKHLAENSNWEKRQLLFDFIQNPSHHFAALTDWASSDSRHLSLLLDQLETICRDLLSQSGINQDGIASLRSHRTALEKERGSKGARDFWFDRFQDITTVRQQMTAPLNKKILTQNLLFGWI